MGVGAKCIRVFLFKAIHTARAMSGKTLSTSTLSLRFMQNAYRAKQLAQVEAEQAQVKDEAEWEVSKEVREAWGIGAKSNEAE